MKEAETAEESFYRAIESYRELPTRARRACILDMAHAASRMQDPAIASIVTALLDIEGAGGSETLEN